MPEAAQPSAPSEPRDDHATIAGWRVLHLFCHLAPGHDPQAIELAIKDCQAGEHQVVMAALLGHKADLAVMALGPSEVRLRSLQSALARAGCTPSWSYVSITEVSEYATGLPNHLVQARLYPALPPDGMNAFCFYPMSKRRLAEDNWYQLGYEDRLELMYGHGKSGRRFAGRVLQLVTGSTGLDDYEWGVTLFARELDDIKACVYTMRFDEASARFAEFGPFVVGTVASPAEVLAALR